MEYAGSSDPTPLSNENALEPLLVAANKHAVVLWRIHSIHAAAARGQLMPEPTVVMQDPGVVDGLAVGAGREAWISQGASLLPRDAPGRGGLLAVCAGACVHVFELHACTHLYRCAKPLLQL